MANKFENIDRMLEVVSSSPSSLKQSEQNEMSEEEPTSTIEEENENVTMDQDDYFPSPQREIAAAQKNHLFGNRTWANQG